MLLKEDVEDPVFWKSIPGAEGGGGREEVDGEGEGNEDEPGRLEGTEGRRLVNRSSNDELATASAVGVAMMDEEGERGGRGWDSSNSVIEGK